jgi:SAM-dependent methyltransferase
MKTSTSNAPTVSAGERHERWVRCLDALRNEPFYAEYKKHVVEILKPRPGGRYLDVGGGTGDDAIAMQEKTTASVIVLDASLNMVMEARRRGSGMVITGDAAALPFHNNTFDGCVADRIFQHLRSPMDALRELVRVTRPGGKIVVIDPDYGTQAVSLGNQRLVRQVLGYRAKHMIRNGILAHRMVGMFVLAGLYAVTVETRTLLTRDPTSPAVAFDIGNWAHDALQRGLMLPADAAAWRLLMEESVSAKTFLYALTFFLTSGKK